MENIKITFILPSSCTDESEANDDMLQAFELCRTNVSQVSWLKESQIESDFAGFSKTDFVIFQEFKGTTFESLKTSKCARILGPWCVLVCLIEGRTIPNFPWPIQNVAMADCIVTCSYLPKSKKMEIKEKIQLMGGCYNDCIMSKTTHLITETVKSDKYVHAVEAGVKIMIAKWVDSVWEKSQNKNTHCNDEEFNKFQCLPFYNLTICSTGITELSKKEELRLLVTKNGATFTGNLALASTDILIVCGLGGTSSAKFKAARGTLNIKCVPIEWVNDSISKGYALPTDNYVIKKITSTPTKNNVTNPNFSLLSAIGGSSPKQRTTLEETVNTTMACFTTSTVSNKRKGSSELEQVIDGLDIKKAKKAGQFLDGCSVYLAGFESEQREKLCKALKLSGATRYDDISERLTHIIVGDPNCQEVKIIKSRNYPCVLVSVQWLLNSIEKKQPDEEQNYLISVNNLDENNIKSPTCRKGLNFLRSTSNTSVDLSQESERDFDQDEYSKMIKQYLPSAKKSQHDESDTLVKLLNQEAGTSNQGETLTQNDTNSDVSCREIFKEQTFMLVDLNSDIYQDLKCRIEESSGMVVSKSYKGIPDYIVTPIFINSGIQDTATNIVNQLWIMEVTGEEEIVDISYYHRPFVLQNTKPLENCVVTISSYKGYERLFLTKLIEALGGISQERFSKIVSIEQNIVGSTHLLSAEANGKKYQAALKWGFPVISKDWLLECAKYGKIVSEEHFLIGESIMPSTYKTPNKSERKNTSTISNATLNVNKHATPPICGNIDYDRMEKTPANQFLMNVKDAADVCSQVTPVNKIMQEVRNSKLLGTPECWHNVKTPTTPLGAFIRPNPSPNLRKEMLKFINQFPDFNEISKPRRNSTPLSELKRRAWSKLGPRQENEPLENESEVQDENSILNSSKINEQNDEVDEKPSICSQNSGIDAKLKLLEDMVNATGANRRSSRNFQSTTSMPEVPNTKDSQPLTVGWDYMDQVNQTVPTKLRIFMISGVDNNMRQTLVMKLESLGANVSDLASYDPSCTHLICPKPARNEKTLACMASGKWILHTSYVDECVEAGTFHNEDEFEFGNPKAKERIYINFDKEDKLRAHTMHWWRKEIARRGYGAFNDMRAIVVASKREPIVRVIEAGGGVVIDLSPPYHDVIHATHCLLEPKSVQNFSHYIPLAQQGIFCVNTLYVSDFLHRTNKDIRDCILPPFTKYYGHH